MSHSSEQNPPKVLADKPESSTHESYDASFFDPLFQAEDRHFWFRARNRVLAATLRRLTRKLPDGYRVLEIGCGNGNVLRVLERVCRRGLVVGMDLFGEGLAIARRRVPCPLVQGDANRPPFGVPFDVICVFDVIEHLENDLQVLCDINALLAPGGAVVVTVPAHAALWSYFDEAAHHCRRYSPELLRGQLQKAGFEIEYLSPYMSVVFPILWLGRRAAALKNRLTQNGEQESDEAHEERVREMARDELKIVPGLNEILDGALRFEARAALRQRHLWCGTSLLAVARKKPA